MSEYQPPDGGSVGLIDRAETFSESDLSLSGDSYAVDSGSLALGSASQASSFYPINNPGRSSSGDGLGVGIIPRADFDSLSVRIAENGEGQSWGGGSPSQISSIQIVETDESVVASHQGPFQFGEIYQINTSLETGEQYYVILRTSGDIRIPFSERNLSPRSNPLFDTNVTYYGATRSLDTTYGITEISATVAATTGTAYIGWPEPPDIYAWDRALFHFAENGGTVDVYVEADDGSGWDEVAGPIARGDEIPADPDDNVRYRVEFERPDTSSNPALDAIYRRRVV